MRKDAYGSFSYSTVVSSRQVQKQVPFLLKLYAVDEPVSEVFFLFFLNHVGRSLVLKDYYLQVRANIKREFQKFGKEKLEPKVANKLLFMGQV
jgi:hypothetical protein